MIKTKMLKTKEFKIKLAIVCTLLALVVLSFFFASEIEAFLNIQETYRRNQVSEKEINKSDYKVTYLDVGQGNSTFIKLPDGKCALIDGGNSMYGDTIVEFLKDEKVDDIDYLIASHADSDHIGGLISVLENFEVKNIYRPFQISGTGENAEDFVASEHEDLADVYLEYMEKTNNRSKISRVTSEVYAEFIEKIYSEFYFENAKKNFSKVTVFYDGLKISGENYSFEFFAPFVREDAIALDLITANTYGFATIGYGADESNNNSSILLFSCYGETFLFTGDASWTSGDKNAEKQDFLETDVVESLTDKERDYLSNVSVFMAGHHGSKYSSGSRLLNLINPKFVVFSVGENNDYGHPHEEVNDRIKQTSHLEEDYFLSTKDDGNISFSSKNGEIKYSLSKYEKDSALTISWYELSMIIFIGFSYIIILIKPRKVA